MSSAVDQTPGRPTPPAHPTEPPAPPGAEPRLARAAGVGVVALLGRQVVSKLLGVVGSVLLARMLLPDDFGLFAIVGLLLFAAGIGGDLGLAGSLVQQKSEPTTEQLRAIFTFQLALTGVTALALIALAPLAGSLARLRPDGVWLIRFSAFYLVTAAFRLVPSVLLSRRLRFSRIAAAEFASAVCYQVITVLGAWAGLRAWALGFGLVGSATVHAIAINALAWWPVGLTWNWGVIRRCMRFGVFFQGAMTLAGIELAAAPILVGWVVSPAALGYVTFALAVVNSPLAIPYVLRQVAFSSMSRVQTDPQTLGHALEATLKATIYALGAAYLPFFLFGREVIELVFSARWLPATQVVTLLAWAWLLREIFAPALTVLNAVGRSGLSFAVQMAATLVSWVLAVLLVRVHGYTGIAEAWLLVSLPLPLLLLALKLVAPLHLWSSVVLPLGPLAAALALGTILSPIPSHAVAPGILLFLKLGVLLAGYLMLVVALERRLIRHVLEAMLFGRRTGWLSWLGTTAR